MRILGRCTRWRSTITAFLLSAGAVARAETPEPQVSIRALAAKLAGREIGQIEIYCIPRHIMTYMRLTPRELERQYSYKLTIRDIVGSASEEDLTTALKGTAVAARSEGADLRSGVIFYGRDGKRMASVYFDASGTVGMIEQTPVSIRGHLFRWVSGLTGSFP